MEISDGVLSVLDVADGATVGFKLPNMKSM
jgi:hypothetical protein